MSEWMSTMQVQNVTRMEKLLILLSRTRTFHAQDEGLRIHYKMILNGKMIVTRIDKLPGWEEPQICQKCDCGGYADDEYE